MRFFSCSAKIVFQKKCAAEFPHFQKRTPDTLPYATGLKRAINPLPSKKFSFTKNALHNFECAFENLKKRSADALLYTSGLKRATYFLLSVILSEAKNPEKRTPDTLVYPSGLKRATKLSIFNKATPINFRNQRV